MFFFPNSYFAYIIDLSQYSISNENRVKETCLEIYTNPFYLLKVFFFPQISSVFFLTADAHDNSAFYSSILCYVVI